MTAQLCLVTSALPLASCHLVVPTPKPHEWFSMCLGQSWSSEMPVSLSGVSSSLVIRFVRTRNLKSFHSRFLCLVDTNQTVMEIVN